MKRLIIFLLLVLVQRVQGQALSQADFVQFQNQAAFLLTQQYYASIKTLVSVAEGNGDYEMAKSKMMTMVFSPTSKVWNDYMGQNTSFPDYLISLRKANRGIAAFSIQGTAYQRDVSTSLIGGDSLVTKVYVQQVVRDVRGPQTIPVAITLVARLRRDPQNQLGYFYNLRIGLIEKATAPPNAVPFSTDIQDKKNPFVTYLAEQTLGVALNKLTNDLVKALPTTASQLGITGFTYKNSAIHDVFSTEVLATLQTDFTNARNGLQASATDKIAQGYQVKGNYEEGGNFFKITADLLNPTGGVIAHVENIDLPLTWFAANRRAFIPAEYAKVQAENKAIDPKLVSDDQQLILEINTGRTNQIFYKGEIMNLMVRTNKPATIRALYRDAGNQLVWLGDKKIDNGQTNIDVLLSKNECSEPFGIERLIVVASTDDMCPLDLDNTKKCNSTVPYCFVNIPRQDGDSDEQAVNKALFSALANSGEQKCSTRGFKPLGSPYKTSKQILITTKDKVI